jgi:hypothetical protein
VIENACKIGCGEIFYSLGNTSTPPENFYFEFELTEPKIVTITIDPSTLADYDIFASWTPESCCNSMSNCDEYTDLGFDEIRSIGPRVLLPGRYYFMINFSSAEEANPTYNLSLSCEETTIQEPTIISPENKTYIDTSVDLTTKCVGDFTSYDVNRSLDGGDNVTFGFSIANDTEFTVNLPLSEGSHNIYVTCFNGSVHSLSEKVYFTLVYPRYNFEAWVGGPSLFTVDKAELINIYVRNLGNVEDSYTISNFTKTAWRNEYPGEDFSYLVDVSLSSSRISSVKPGGIGGTFAIITLQGPVDSGEISFNLTSDTNSSVFQETLPLEIKAGFPISLPEFKVIGFIQLLVLVFLLRVIISLKKP